MSGTGSGVFDALTLLRAAGHPIDLLDERQRRVFAELSEPEVTLLNSIKKRLDDAAGEVEGQELKLV
ncbi:aroma-sacti cluster domain-containing protein [Nonomuraea sp. SBT364]|uniref:aroma-sacti cluster domain-containing protein n=1 Tax=Nonomuraea sp. SBT364 TaxID=1580530 RepID=UPI00066B3F7A|nr:aroma-sacti cluster domain-containing protein [Nonomuraea sp. SBT364]